MKRINLNTEWRFVDLIKELSKTHRCEIYLVGSQLVNNGSRPKDINIIGVMDDDVFINFFGECYECIERDNNKGKYTKEVVQYISYLNSILINLKYKSGFPVAFTIKDRTSFNKFDSPSKKLT